jgi:hypothetical protein
MGTKNTLQRGIVNTVGKNDHPTSTKTTSNLNRRYYSVPLHY